MKTKLTPAQKVRFVSHWRRQIREAEKLQRKLAPLKAKGLKQEQIDALKMDHAMGLAYEFAAQRLLDLLFKMGLTREELQIQITRGKRQWKERKINQGKIKSKLKKRTSRAK